ncbi:hypothetical protein [Novacetimonas pomaceti]|uniref:hypothetical protein n=1 Tax=Novacetimonas pomaceti TaxID=2021998 RepID=UPI0010576BFF|nr:hypothetical protein [Novacetimonas pomaceti]
MTRYSTQIREVINRNTVISLALEQGFNAFLPVYDGGIDFILYRESDGETRNVQLKGRWIIDRKYIGRKIWIAFPVDGDWYLVPHDEMVRQAEEQGYVATPSWIDGGAYSTPRPSKALLEACQPYHLKPIEIVADAAASPTTMGAK